MDLFDRVGRLIRANLSPWINQTADPELLLEQQVYALQEDLIRLRQAVAAAIATQKRCERQSQQALTLAEEWQQRAYLALQQGQEAQARAALTRRQPYVEQARLLQAQLEQQRLTLMQLKRNMTELEIKVAEARARKDLFVARARAAEASCHLHQMLGQVNPVAANNAFERMAEKVQQLEAEAAAIAALNAADPLEEQFATLEWNYEVEQQLEGLRNRYRDRSTPT